MSIIQREGPSERDIAAAVRIDKRMPRAVRLPRQLAVAARIRGGDKAAFAGLCDALLDRLLNYAYYRIGDKAGAEAFVVAMCDMAWKRRQTLLDGGLNGSIWLLQVCREVLLHTYDNRYEVHEKVCGDDPLLLQVCQLDPMQQEWMILRCWLRARTRDAGIVMGLAPQQALMVQANALAHLHELAA
jgi:DNA-directed RNA polymerase specialized sigma24 family protein